MSGLSVTNFNIDNASGQAVRQDIEACFLALQGQNREANDTDLASSQCVRGMTFLNDTTKILKVRNSSNNGFTDIGHIDQANLGLLPKAGGTMSGVLEASAGSESTPAIHFGDTGTGFYRVSSNILGLSLGGTRQFEFNATEFQSRTDITIERTGADASFQLRTNSNTNNAIIDLATVAGNPTTVLGADFGLRLIRGPGTDGVSKLHHRSDSATANNLIIESQAGASGGIILQTGGTPHVNAQSEVASKSRFAIAHNGTVLTGEAIRINQDPVTATGNVGSGIKVCGPASASTEYDGFGMSINAKDIVGIFNRTNTTGVVVEFKYNGSVVGSISTNGSATTYNPSSDYRLKQDINNINDAITKIKTLRPVTFRWKNNVDIGYDSGFIAHEVQETGHYNHLVTGVKDGTRTSHSNPEENEPDYQGVDYSKFTPMLVAALQEAVAKIETLETKVAALEGS